MLKNIKNFRIIQSRLLFVLGLISMTLWNCNTKKSESSDTSTQSTVYQQPQAGTIFMYPERIPLEAGGFYNAERGIMFVPTNRSKADTDIIGLEIYRFRAKDESKSNNCLLYTSDAADD